MVNPMTPDEWAAMQENDYAPNPTPAWVDYATGIIMLVLGTAVGALFMWLLFEAFRFFAKVML